MITAPRTPVGLGAGGRKLWADIAAEDLDAVQRTGWDQPGADIRADLLAMQERMAISAGYELPRPTVIPPELAKAIRGESPRMFADLVWGREIQVSPRDGA